MSLAIAQSTFIPSMPQDQAIGTREKTSEQLWEDLAPLNLSPTLSLAQMYPGTVQLLDGPSILLPSSNKTALKRKSIAVESQTPVEKVEKKSKQSADNEFKVPTNPTHARRRHIAHHQTRAPKNSDLISLYTQNCIQWCIQLSAQTRIENDKLCQLISILRKKMESELSKSTPRLGIP